MKLAIVEKKTFLAGLQCTLTSSCAKKSLTKPKSLIVPKKVRNLCFGILVKKLAHTHGFEHETSGLKSKHLTTRPRTRETCELPREIRVVARKKKHPHFPITLAYRKCNEWNILGFYSYVHESLFLQGKLVESTEFTLFGRELYGIGTYITLG